MADLTFISDHLGNLRKSEMKVARFVLENAQAVVHSSISELAENAGVSEPTVLRFSRRLGFRGFQDFKIYLAQATIPAMCNIHESVDGTEAAPELVRKVFDSNIAAIRSTVSTLDFSAVTRVTELMAASTHLVFYGLGGSGVVAMDAYHKFFRIGIPCQWFNDTHMAIMAASMLDRHGVFVAISHSGATLEVVRAVETANKVRAETVAIVSHGKSPVSSVARHSLCVASTETQFKFEPMSSRIAQLSVIDTLAVGVALSRSDETVRNLDKTRKALVDTRY
ncbi:MAG: MurR/RpiR family transcriptional regulator [Spirochaetales bacterium]|nr:MurR/RpiR family transcriptional regulator [Spirochaetales bacterium]